MHHVSKSNLLRAVGIFAAASVLASMAVSGPAMAATTNPDLTLKAGEGTTLAGHTFNIYQLGRYEDVETDAGYLKSVSAYPVNTAADTWVKSALDATGQKIATGDNSVSTLLRLDTTANSDTLRKIAADLEKSVKGQTPTLSNQTANAATLSLTVPEGFYLVTDAQGVPIIISTTVGGLSFANEPLGVTYIKSKLVSVDKKVQASDGTWKDAASVTAGQTYNFKATMTLPNALAADTVTLEDTVAHLDKDGTGIKINVMSNGAVGKDITDQFTITTSATGYKAVSKSTLLGSYANQQIQVTYSAHVTDASRTGAASNALKMTVGFKPDTDPNGATSVDGSDTVTMKTYGLDLKKVSAAQGNPVVAGAGFKILNETTNKWLSWHSDTNQWTESADEASATELTSDSAGIIHFNSLGAGSYKISETTVPKGYFSTNKPTFRAVITDEGKITVTGVDNPGLTSGMTNADDSSANSVVVVKNINNMTQLPQTGGTGIAVVVAFVVLMLVAAGVFVTKARFLGARR